MKLDFFQIIYDDKHRLELYPFSTEIFSKESHRINTSIEWTIDQQPTGLTEYFENAFIGWYVPRSAADYISVCSWRLKRKRVDAAHYLGGIGKDYLDLKKIENSDFDIGIFTPHSPSHKPLNMAANWHGKAWVDAFNAFKPFLSQLGKVPDELKYAIYENHFIARGEIYRDYVSTCLIPAIGFIGEQEVFRADSGYLAKKKDDEEIKRVQRLLGRNDWPLIPFILERLFSFYIQNKNLKIINL